MRSKAMIGEPKETGIIMSRPMVQALKERRKTQTRRIIKPQPQHVQHHEYKGKVIYEGENRAWCWKDLALDNIWDFPDNDDRRTLARLCPYGFIGDRLWVRETWQIVRAHRDFESDYIEELEIWDSPIPKSLSEGWDVTYAADHDDFKYHKDDRFVERWRPSIFMPRVTSRFLLEITEIRVQRLQEISHEDAIAEGCQGYNWVPSSPYISGPHTDDGELPVEEYQGLWESINGPHSWILNPFVWAITFKELERRNVS